MLIFTLLYLPEVSSFVSLTAPSIGLGLSVPTSYDPFELVMKPVALQP